MATTTTEHHAELRFAVRDLCSRFPDADCRDLDARRITTRDASRRMAASASLPSSKVSMPTTGR
jgi:hypothetical protein